MWRYVTAVMGVTTSAIGYAMYKEQRNSDTTVTGRLSVRKDIPTMHHMFITNCDKTESNEQMNINGFINSFLPDGMKKERIVHLGPTSDIAKVLKQLDADGNGMLSYGEYCALFSFLSVPEAIYRKAFVMFDADGNAKLDYTEFMRMMESLKVDHTAKLELSESIKDQFFGRDRMKELSYKEFIDVVSNLRSAVRKAEFDILDVSQHGMLPTHIIHSLMTREKAIPQPLQPNTITMVSKDIYVKFCDVLRMSEDVLKAFDIFVASKPIDPAEGHREGLSKEEFSRSLRYSGLSMSVEEIDIFFAVFYPSNNQNQTIDFREVKSMCAYNPTLFSTHPIDFKEAERNTVQQFVHCMTQR